MPEFEQLSSADIEKIQSALSRQIIGFPDVWSVKNYLNKMWEKAYLVPEESEILETGESIEDIDLSDLEDLIEADDDKYLGDFASEEFEADDYIDFDLDTEDEYLKKEAVWLIELSIEFIKSVKKIDKKLKGRILDAIENLSKEPDSQRGDTVKPLTAELKGLWRYRIGDYRLIYRPDNKSRKVTLVTFDPRSSAY